MSLDERRCGVTRPARLFCWLGSRVLVARRGFLEVRLAALTPSWHSGEPDSPTSLCERDGWGGVGVGGVKIYFTIKTSKRAPIVL